MGAAGDDSDANGVGVDVAIDDDAEDAGAVRVFVFEDQQWSLRSYIKAKASAAGDLFGTSVALSADGGTLAVGAPETGGVGAVHLY